MSSGSIEGRPIFAVKGLQFVAKASQYPSHDRIYPSQKMMPRNALLEIEEVK